MAARAQSQIVRLLEYEPSTRRKRKDDGVGRDIATPQRVEPTIGAVEVSGPCQITRLERRCCDAADFRRCFVVHRPRRQAIRRPELQEVAIRIGEANGGPFFAFLTGRHRARMRDAMSVQPADMILDLLGADEPAIAWSGSGRREWFVGP